MEPTKVGMLPTIVDKDVADSKEVTNEPTNPSVAASDPAVIVPATRVVILPYGAVKPAAETVLAVKQIVLQTKLLSLLFLQSLTKYFHK